MRYEEYEKKIIKRAKVRKVIYRFRFPIIIFATVTILTSGGLVGTKGIVSEKEMLLPQYSYGEMMSYLSTAFLSNVSYEFTEFEEENWSEEVPYLVGKYKMRSCGENSAKTYYYGKEQVFEIVPKEVIAMVSEASLTYGELPTLKIEGLCFQDRFDNNYTMSYSDKTKPVWTITPNLDSIRIYAQDGKDVTTNYSITIQSKDVNILKRSISVSSRSDSKMYDGVLLKEEGFDITSGSLVEGDSIEMVTTSDIVNAGSKDNKQTYKITSNDNLDMTDHYQINDNPGTLTIAKREIYVKSIDHEYTYDGLDKKFPIEDADIYQGDGLANDEEIEFSYKDDSSFVNAGTYSNEFKAKVVKGDVDVSGNYNIHYSFGTTTINKRNLELDSDSGVFTYDKEKHSVNTVTIKNETSLAEKDELHVSKYDEFVNSGEYENKIEIEIVDKVTGVDAMKNYNVTLGSGQITINKVDITVNIIAMEVVYDGKPHKNTFEISEGELVADDEIEESINPERIDVGVYDNDTFVATIKDEKGLSNDANYNVSYTRREEALTITKRPIAISSLSKVKLYDAKPISTSLAEDEELYEITSGSLADDEYIDFKYVNDPVNAGKYPIEKELVIYHQIGEEKDTAKDKVVTSNYDIDFTDGEFTINKRAITIQTLDIKHVYNRETTLPLDAETFKVLDDTGDGLVEGDKVSKLTITCTGINVGTYDYDVDESSLKIVDKNNNDVTANYKATFINTGKVTITQRPVTVKLLDAFKIYDGKPLSSTRNTSTGLLTGDEFVFDGLPSITHVWEGPLANNPSGIRIFMSDKTTEVTDNYKITNNTNGNLEIRPRPITVESPTIEKVFDGQELPVTAYTKITSGSLVEGDKIVITSMNSRDNKYYHVIDEDNTFTIKIVKKDDESVDLTEDYDIKLVPGKIKITARQLSIGMYQTNIMYDGAIHNVDYPDAEVTSSSDKIYLTSGTLPDGYHLYASASAVGLCLVGSTPMIPNYYLTETDPNWDAEVSDFDISIAVAGVTISRRYIIIETIGGSVLYDDLDGKSFGYDLSDEDFAWICSGTLAPGDYIASFDRMEMKEIGTYQNGISNIVIKNAMGNIVTDCYQISIIYEEVVIYEL